MNTKKKAFKITGSLILVIGIIFGFILSALIVWGDLEASLFTSGMRAEKSLTSLRCPILITKGETGTISATINNPTEKLQRRFVIANVSEGYASLMREIKTSVSIPPDEKQKLEWEFSPEDAAFDKRIVLFRVYINPLYPYPSLGGNCGIVRLDIPGMTGNQLVNIMAVVSLVSIGLGIGMIEYGIRPLSITHSRSMINSAYALAVIVICTGVVGYLGLWMPATLLLAISILMMGIIITRSLGRGVV